MIDEVKIADSNLVSANDKVRKIHIPSDLVVNRWASDVESGSHRDLLLQDDV
jgi:hypothetical protein